MKRRTLRSTGWYGLSLALMLAGATGVPLVSSDLIPLFMLLMLAGFYMGFGVVLARL